MQRKLQRGTRDNSGERPTQTARTKASFKEKGKKERAQAVKVAKKSSRWPSKRRGPYPSRGRPGSTETKQVQVGKGKGGKQSSYLKDTQRN